MMYAKHWMLMLLLIGINTISIAQEASPSRKPFIVVIDPGHGGIDSGALSRNGIMEKDIVLSIATKMLKLNEIIYNGSLEIYLTRYTDTLISLTDRSRVAKKLRADVFISLHCNQSNNLTVAGTEVYIHPKSEVKLKESANLGYSIQKGLSDELGVRNRGIKHGNFQVLRDSPKGSASILLELGFLSQTDEAIYLSKGTSQYAIAMLILVSLFKF